MNFFLKTILTISIAFTSSLYCTKNTYLDDVVYDNDLRNGTIDIEKEPIGTYFVQNKPKHKIYTYWFTKNNKKYKGISAGTFEGKKTVAFAPLFCAEENDILPTPLLVSKGGSDKLPRSKFFPVVCINLLLEYDVNPLGFGEYEKVKLETNGEN